MQNLYNKINNSGKFSKNYKLAILSIISSCSSFSLYSQPASAQATAPQEAAADTDADGGEIVVTARKRSESLQDIPLSVSAFGSQQLENLGAGELRDLQHSVPGLNYSDRGLLQTTLTIRGVGGDARNIGIESGVGMYVDGVYIPRTSGFNSDLAEVEQVEVLRGPQGTLFGKNTIGGVINTITRKPADKLEGMLYGTYGNYNAMRFQAAVSVPLTDNLFSKVTVASWDRDGYVHNLHDGQDYMNEDRRGGRLQLRYAPSSALEINLSADVTRDRTRALQSQPGSAAGAAAPHFIDNRYVINADQDNIVNRDMWGASATVDYTFDNDSTLTFIGAYRDIDVFVKSDVDQLPIDLFHSEYFTDDSKMISQELRLVSPGRNRFRYVLGLYYYNQKGSANRLIYLQNRAASITNVFGVEANSYAAYANADFDILPELTATGGIRYTYEKKSGDLFQLRPGLNYDIDNMRRTDENVSWTGSLTWKIDPRFTTYATVSRGYKSGGFNLDGPSVAGLTAADLTFAPESVTNYEIGAKGRISDLLRFSVSLFDMKYQDKQVVQLTSTSASQFVSTQITNAGSAKIKGFEAELTVTPMSGLDLTFTGSHLDAKYSSFENAATNAQGQFVSYTGNRIEFTPDWSGSATAAYHFRLGNGEMRLSGSATYTGNTYFQPDNLPINFQKHYMTYDARIAYEFDNGLTLAAWGKNLGQKDYYIFSRVFAGLDQKTFGEPRTYGVEARYRF